MDKATLAFLAQYNSIVNKKMNEHISKLTEDQWNDQFGGYFSSIKSMCNHIYTCDYNWLKRFSKMREFKFIKDNEIRKGLDYGVMYLENIQDYLSKREWLDKKIAEFIDEINENELDKKLNYIDSHGNEYEKNFGLLILHMFNHDTHHRGMISIYLEELKIENDYSNIYDQI